MRKCKEGEFRQKDVGRCQMKRKKIEAKKRKNLVTID